MSDTYKVTFSPSQLRNMSESQISSLFHSSNWERIDADARLNLCQELENRLAEKDGVNARTVVAEKMNGSLYGVQYGDVIEINSDMLKNGVFCTTYTDENGNLVTSTHAVAAPNWNTYDTIVHEHTHGVSLDRGEMPYTYISSKTDYDLYRIQGEERMAFENGNNMTTEAIAISEAAMNQRDNQKDDYLDSIKSDSYDQSLENAKLKYNDPFIDRTLATFINDRDNGIIRENPSPSYQQIEVLYNEQLQRQLVEIMQSKEQLAGQNVMNDTITTSAHLQEQHTEASCVNNGFQNSDTSETNLQNNYDSTNEVINSEEMISNDDGGMSSVDDGGMSLND